MQIGDGSDEPVEDRAQSVVVQWVDWGLLGVEENRVDLEEGQPGLPVRLGYLEDRLTQLKEQLLLVDEGGDTFEQ